MPLDNACKRCFSRKQKCDRLQPSCSQCIKAKAPCEPRMTAHVETEDTSYTEATVSSLGTIDYMKKRIRYLEAQASQGQQLPSPSDSLANDVSYKDHPQDRTSTSYLVAARDVPKDRTMSDALDEIGYLSLASTGDQTAHVMMISGEMSYANFVLAALGIRSTNPALASHPSIHATHLPSHGWLNSLSDPDSPLTSSDAMVCIEKFIEYSNLLHPYISKEKCFNAYETVRKAEQDDNMSQVALASPELVIIAYVSVGLGMLLTNQGTAINTIVPRIMKRVTEVIPRLITHASNVAIIECLMLLVLLCLHTPAAGSAWYLLGLAMSKAVSLGLHRQTRRPASPELASDREKLFWTLYKLDRTMSLALNRPFTINDEQIIINLPEMPHPSTMTDYQTRTQALQIWSLYHSQMLSDWRNDPSADAEFYLSTFDYWRNTYQGITERAMKDHESGTTYEKLAFQSNLKIFESQLCLRAITQLAVIISTQDTGDDARARLRNLVLAEVPRFVKCQWESIEKFGSIASFLKGYDALSAGVIFIDALYRPNLHRYGLQQNKNSSFDQHPLSQTYIVRAADTKVVASCSDILTHVGERFTSMRVMKDILWAFMAAAEAQMIAIVSSKGYEGGSRHTEQSQTDCVKNLMDIAENSEMEIPLHICRIMSACLGYDPEVFV